jgi:hypothetical protein
MSRLGPRKELQLLTTFVGSIETQFLSRHLQVANLGAPSKPETLDVAAYVVLAHGALENFIEGLCLWALGHVHKHWQLKRRASRCTASLILYWGDEHPADDVSQSVFDTLRLALDGAKSAYSRDLEKNNGIAMNHLRSLFRPLGIDVPEDPTLVASLELLIKMRHQWAHQSRFGAQTVRTAADVKVTVADCLTLATQLATNAAKARP